VHSDYGGSLRNCTGQLIKSVLVEASKGAVTTEKRLSISKVFNS
jgi:hypothetical protein